MLNRRPRRQVNQMNVVPYIDVMLVLLVIFMVTAPMFTPGVIDVPSVSRARTVDNRPVEVIIDDTSRITVKTVDKDIPAASPEELVSIVKSLDASLTYAISANKDLKYSEVIHIADMLHKAGIQHVALTVKQGTGG